MMERRYENMRNAISILKLISQGEEDIKGGKSKLQEEVFADIENLKGRMGGDRKPRNKLLILFNRYIKRKKEKKTTTSAE